MNITFAGVGSAFTDQRYYQSSFVIEQKGKRLLVDCGGDGRHSLAALGVTNANVGQWLDGVYISHLHADHVGGLEFLAFCTYFNPLKPKLKLYISADQIDDLWAVSRVGLNSIEGVSVELKTFFDVQPVVNGIFNWQGIDFALVPCVHVWGNDVLMKVYGLQFNNVYFTSDTVITDRTLAACRNANLIFHDCQTYPGKGVVHAHYEDLVQLPQGYGTVDPKLGKSCPILEQKS